jgi:hypothetical protein
MPLDTLEERIAPLVAAGGPDHCTSQGTGRSNG